MSEEKPDKDGGGQKRTIQPVLNEQQKQAIKEKRNHE